MNEKLCPNRKRFSKLEKVLTLISRFHEEDFGKLNWKYNKFTNFKKVLKKDLNTIDSPITVGSTSTSLTLRITGFRINLVPKTASAGCGVAIGTIIAN